MLAEFINPRTLVRSVYLRIEFHQFPAPGRVVLVDPSPKPAQVDSTER